MCNDRWGLCPKCLYLRDLTKHHIYPRRFFGTPKNSPILHLCRDCHDKIEELLPRHDKLSKRDYLQICRDFLGEDWIRAFDEARFIQ